MAKSMGVNTISTYLIWNYHELSNGSFDYSSKQKDFTAFVELCQQNDLVVLFRPGPYICGEWDFGGLPSYLLFDRDIKLRHNDNKNYTEPLLRKLFTFILPLMHYNGGNIIMVQLENEYGLWKYPQKEHVEFLRAELVKNGITGYFYTDDGGVDSISENTHLPGTILAFNGREISQVDIDKAKAKDPNVPVFVGEIHPGKQKHWGEGPWIATDVTRNLQNLINNNVGVSFYMFYGGTNFGLTAGASNTGNTFSGHLTSYDMGAPVDEQGRVSFNFLKYRELYNSYFGPLPDIPEPLPT